MRHKCSFLRKQLLNINNLNYFEKGITFQMILSHFLIRLMHFLHGHSSRNGIILLFFLILLYVMTLCVFLMSVHSLNPCEPGAR